ncbi:MAG TPA: CHAT domain-containing protein [Thermoanaerobaculia bacterium]|nr:CHAT domain-containing protein [Thermoanaerobaculia bacterium]
MKPQFLRMLAIAFLCLGAASDTGPGVVFEEVGKGSALETAGLRPGDLVLAWERGGSQGEIRTAFDWLWVKNEQAPRGGVRLRGERDGAAVSFEVPKGTWDGKVRPRTAAEPWVLFETGEALSKRGGGPKAQEALQAALAEAADAQTRVAILETLGKSYELANELASAEESYRSALAAGEAAWGESLAVARTMTRLGQILRLRNRLDEAEQFQTRGLEIQQCLAPDSLEVADTLNLLSHLEITRGDLEKSADLDRRALAIQERWAPGSLVMARSLSSLGIGAIERGRFDEATAALQRALEIQERQAPGSPHVAASLANLGFAARQRGDLESAADLLGRALAIWEKFAPEGVGISPILTNLGAIARERGDPAAAEKHFRRALAIWSKAAPDGIGVAGAYDALGILARSQGRLDEAWGFHKRALDLREKLAPEGYDVARGLKELGIVAEARGDLKTAQEHLTKAQALFARLTPGTAEEAQALQLLGRLHRRMNRPDEAARFFALAVEALESQVGRLGGPQDTQAAYRARYEEIYRDAIESELRQGHAAQAFHLVERSRARIFLTLLAERDLAFSGELPAAIESSRRANAARYDQTLRELARWSEKAGDDAREALHRELGRLRQERDRISDEIRKASPRLGALNQPQALDLEAARQVLDPGTLALSYSVGKDATALFAVTPEGGLQVKMLPVGEERLRKDVESFLGQVRSQGRPAGDLYRELIAPVADLVERSERVLILPDGPLHRLPFGALVRDDGRFLTEWKPLHTALSLTVYGTLRAPSPSQGRSRLVAFGDPRFPESMRAKTELGPGLRRFDWSSLPYSRREVEQIAGVYPGALVYLGDEATEEHAKSIHDARILHFATHGYTDDRTPLDSALVLTIPEELSPGRGVTRENGLLQVWEIFESVRLGADLVVLSACESALGRELSGEGLIGLTRAFQYAGARSVVASLWSVADQVTAELMARFHRHLAAGLPKDQALRAAQLELIRAPVKIATAKGQTIETDASAPFFWAAFQLFGDWR